jgi:sugar O-acyltransferase (sialic acid O-acetyltransferase NeuD family)
VSAETVPVVVIGGGGHAKVLLSVLARLRGYAILGYLDPADRGPILGHPWLGDDSSARQLARDHRGLALVLGIGKTDGRRDRLPLLESLAGAGSMFPAVVAPTAFVADDVQLGEGTVVCDGAIVQTGTRVGRACIVNTGARVDHDCVLDDDVHIAPGAVLSGGVQVGRGTLIGVGACCRQNVRVGARCTIGAGAAVTADCRDGAVCVGVPARAAGA